jgi:hypothetical protein
MKCDEVCLGEFNLTSRGGTGSESKTCKSLTRETVDINSIIVFDYTHTACDVQGGSSRCAWAEALHRSSGSYARGRNAQVDKIPKQYY